MSVSRCGAKLRQLSIPALLFSADGNRMKINSDAGSATLPITSR